PEKAVGSSKFFKLSEKRHKDEIDELIQQNYTDRNKILTELTELETRHLQIEQLAQNPFCLKWLPENS
ncbi:12375_t:CDS:1, partial [Gigaspora rosea]